MVWAYYDESGEYDRETGKLLNMSIATCVASPKSWEGFAEAWKAVLREEGLPCFHMKEFEAWKPPFDFKLTDGGRDHDRHKRLLNRLLELMLDHIEWFSGFSAGWIVQDVRRAHFATMETCVVAAVTHAVHDLWDFYQEPINLVFAKQSHFSSSKIADVIELYNWGAGVGRIKPLVWDEPKNLPQLQAADILAFEMSKVQREGRPDRHPFLYLRDGAKARGKFMTLKWGPFINLPQRLAEKIAKS